MMFMSKVIVLVGSVKDNGVKTWQWSNRIN